VLEARKGKTLAELAKQHDIDSLQIARWMNEAERRLARIFGQTAGQGGPQRDIERAEIQKLHARVAELTAERDLLATALGRFPGSSARR